MLLGPFIKVFVVHQKFFPFGTAQTVIDCRLPLEHDTTLSSFLDFLGQWYNVRTQFIRSSRQVRAIEAKIRTNRLAMKNYRTVNITEGILP